MAEHLAYSTAEGSTTHVAVHGKFHLLRLYFKQKGVSGGISESIKTLYFMKMRSEYFELLHEDGGTELSKGK
jgi:hypothetical protein